MMRITKTSKQARTPAGAAPSPLVRTIVLGWSVLTLGTLLLARSMDLKLGQGSFWYRFSSLQYFRLLSVIGVLPAIIAIALAIVAATASRRSVAMFLGMVAMIWLAAWSWWAPPKAMVQHSFNLRSPSHE